MTIAEIELEIEAYSRRKKDENINRLYSDWNIGQLVGIAICAPKEYPTWGELRDSIKTESKPQVQTAEEMEKKCRMMAIAFTR